jgi:alanyl-tRNA synthetase
MIRALPGSKGVGPAWEIEVTAMRRPSAGVIVHVGEVIAGQPRVGDRAVAEIDLARRHDIMRNHTATHLLHAALHEVLGDHARQAGSLVAPDHLRFDFNHPEAMTAGQIEHVERIVNEAIAADMPVMPKLKPRDDAIADGAMALFGEKYGETVRTISILQPQALLMSEVEVSRTDAAASPGRSRLKQIKYSYELCGGTHLERTSDIGVFLIVSEGSAAAGVRRIEAVTGRGAYALVRRRFRALEETASALKSALEDTPAKVASLQDELSSLRRALAELQAQRALAEFGRLLSQVELVKDVHLLTADVPDADLEMLRALGDRFREEFPQRGAAVIASRATVLAVLTEDLVKRGLKAADLILAVGGRGGGRPAMAQGSLPAGSQVSAARSKLSDAIKARVN